MNRNEFLEALPLSHLVLKLTSASLDIATDDAIEYISILISGTDGEVNAMKLASSGNHLLVEQPAVSRRRKPAASSWLQVTIRIPASWKGRCDVRTFSGCITASGLCGTDLTMQTVSGRICASAMHFSNAVIRAGSGNVLLNDVCFANAELHSTSGTIIAQACSIAQCSLMSNSGHTALGFLTPFSGIQARCITGALDIAAPIADCNIQSHTSSGRIATIGLGQDENADSSVVFSSLSGNLSITSTLPAD